MKLYVAYGSNLNKNQMSRRCPGARPLYSGYLNNWELIYRGSKTGAYASIRRKKNSRVPVGIWEITPDDEIHLDMYEGYPRFYQKRNVFVTLENDRKVKAMVYIMRDDAKPGEPSANYIDTIIKGYKDFYLDFAYLIESISKNLEETKKERN